MTDRATAPRDTAAAPEDEVATADATATDSERSRGLSTEDLAASGRSPEPSSRAEDRPSRLADADRPSRGAEADRPRQMNAETPLFDRAAATDLQRRWQAIQVEFVDEPRGAVERADGLVAEVMQQLAESFATERRELEAAWQGGREASTEDLRQAIRRYRSFFNRLLSV